MGPRRVEVPMDVAEEQAGACWSRHETCKVMGFQESQDGVPNLEDRGARNIHSLDGTKKALFCDSWLVFQF